MVGRTASAGERENVGGGCVRRYWREGARQFKFRGSGCSQVWVMMTYCLGGEGEEGGKAVAEGNNQHLDNQLFDIIWLKKTDNVYYKPDKNLRHCHTILIKGLWKLAGVAPLIADPSQSNSTKWPILPELAKLP